MAAATLESEEVVSAAVPEECEDDRYTAFKKLIIRLSEKLGIEDIRAIVYLEDLPEDLKTLSALEVLLKLERGGKFKYTYVSNLLDLLKSINRIDLANSVDDYRKKYTQPKKGASDPIATSRPRRHMRTLSSVSGISLQDVAEVMREGESSEGGPGSVVSLSSSCPSVNSLRTADLTLLNVDAALDRKEGSLSPSPVSFHRCSSGGSVGAVDDTLEGPQSRPFTPQLSPTPTLSATRSPYYKATVTHQPSSPLPSHSTPMPYTTQLRSVVSSLQEWNVNRSKLNKSIYNHQTNAFVRLPNFIAINLTSLGLPHEAKFHFILHPYGLDIDSGKNATLEVTIHLPSNILGHALDCTRVHLHASAYDNHARETINAVTVEGNLNQHKMHVFGFLPHLALKESRSQRIVVRGHITAMLTIDAPGNSRLSQKKELNGPHK